ncbi:uncharacterized protein MONOS_966 [Monocercomonoides exilis]|uniref:uncharacterized protein n=1 Tax=Monocercomonoides exilis TaxID=2049356 RepID=UPI00355AB2F8|nr:hypothetical protein MONOS_966 [Monocercomonoides exilis]|eukprot:MONOS_966.1-p1 / transcript=MONOS_966.1 / gene=MONOS_966 / organism=Monocercomonoides_exilis_PA203 / gene_product=unspecified product / transcript_product=unspecified product / location=Mono_scaffold00016:82134-85130(-) / protein_length=999 / sequence_SO=supercontig / SO=protein_coding / is_pseudo=false
MSGKNVINVKLLGSSSKISSISTKDSSFDENAFGPTNGPQEQKTVKSPSPLSENLPEIELKKDDLYQSLTSQFFIKEKDKSDIKEKRGKNRKVLKNACVTFAHATQSGKFSREDITCRFGLDRRRVSSVYAIFSGLGLVKEIVSNTLQKKSKLKWNYLQSFVLEQPHSFIQAVFSCRQKRKEMEDSRNMLLEEIKQQMIREAKLESIIRYKYIKRKLQSTRRSTDGTNYTNISLSILASHRSELDSFCRIIPTLKSVLSQSAFKMKNPQALGFPSITMSFPPPRQSTSSAGFPFPSPSSNSSSSSSSSSTSSDSSSSPTTFHSPLPSKLPSDPLLPSSLSQQNLSSNSSLSSPSEDGSFNLTRLPLSSSENTSQSTSSSPSHPATTSSPAQVPHTSQPSTSSFSAPTMSLSAFPCLAPSSFASLTSNHFSTHSFPSPTQTDYNTSLDSARRSLLQYSQNAYSPSSSALLPFPASFPGSAIPFCLPPCLPLPPHPHIPSLPRPAISLLPLTLPPLEQFSLPPPLSILPFFLPLLHPAAIHVVARTDINAALLFHFHSLDIFQKWCLDKLPRISQSDTNNDAIFPQFPLQNEEELSIPEAETEKKALSSNSIESAFGSDIQLSPLPIEEAMPRQLGDDSQDKEYKLILDELSQSDLEPPHPLPILSHPLPSSFPFPAHPSLAAACTAFSFEATAARSADPVLIDGLPFWLHPSLSINPPPRDLRQRILDSAFPEFYLNNTTASSSAAGIGDIQNTTESSFASQSVDSTDNPSSSSLPSQMTGEVETAVSTPPNTTKNSFSDSTSSSTSSSSSSASASAILYPPILQTPSSSQKSPEPFATQPFPLSLSPGNPFFGLHSPQPLSSMFSFSPFFSLSPSTPLSSNLQKKCSIAHLSLTPSKDSRLLQTRSAASSAKPFSLKSASANSSAPIEKTAEPLSPSVLGRSPLFGYSPSTPRRSGHFSFSQTAQSTPSKNSNLEASTPTKPHKTLHFNYSVSSFFEE